MTDLELALAALLLAAACALGSAWLEVRHHLRRRREAERERDEARAGRDEAERELWRWDHW